MAKKTGQRLSKVAKEFNVSLSAITEFLESKGHPIEKNPMAKVSEEHYDLLAKEYQSEKAAKAEAEKVSPVGSARAQIEAAAAEKEKQAAEAPAVVPEKEAVVQTPKEEVKVVEEVQKPKEDTTTVKSEPLADNETTEEKEVEGEKSNGIKIISKIDLDAIGGRKKTPKKKEEKKVDKAEAKAIAKKEEKKVEKKVEKKAAPVTPKIEPEKVAEPKAKKDEVADIHETKVEKLEGPKVMGKIVLPEPREKKKPIASSSAGAGAFGKKKRKRIDTKPASGGNNNNNDNRGKRPAGGRPAGGRRAAKVEPTSDEIQAQIKETLARLSGAGKSKASKHRRTKREIASEKSLVEAELEAMDKKVLKVTEFVSASQLAQMMEVQVNEIISTCMSLGMFVSINQRLDAETLGIVAEEFGYELEFVSVEVQEAIQEEVDSPEDLQERPPIVTVMGHVDHGKTSLLDHIRKANVIAGEAGGITQHIGAYNVMLENKKTITFLDTPGHEAFTAMRARGAQVTDIAIIVVSADDGVMPQTKEAINHAQAAGVPIVIAINKIDKPGANPDKVKEELSQINVLVEEWGGKIQSQEVSAKKGLHVDELLEKVLLEAELLELKANPNKRAQGTVVESELDKGRGYVSTILVESGTLNVGDIVLAGCYSGKVKALHNERAQVVNKVGPATPVLLLGLSGAPQSGDKFNVMEDEREAREIASKRLQLQREQGIRTQKHITLDEIGRRLAIGDFQELNVIVKGDVDGSVEALADSLQKLSTEKISVKIIHKSVGAISDSDVLLASASDAIVVGFQVRPSASARKLAESEQIDIRLYSIIYDAINEIKAAMEGMLAPEFEEKVICNLDIRTAFDISKVGTIAGCFVTNGKIFRNSKVRIIRDGIVIHSGVLGSLKRFKDDVKEVGKGYECGLNIKDFNDIKEGDTIEGYELVEVKAKL